MNRKIGQMDREQLACLIEKLVDISTKCNTRVSFYCIESNDTLRSVALEVGLKGCEFYKTTPESKEVHIATPELHSAPRHPGAQVTPP